MTHTFTHSVKTLTGSAQQIAANTACRALILQPLATNSNVIYVGGPTVASDSYAFRLEAPDGGIPPAPFILGELASGAIQLGDLYVLGTNGEKLCIGYL